MQNLTLTRPQTFTGPRLMDFHALPRPVSLSTGLRPEPLRAFQRHKRPEIESQISQQRLRCRLVRLMQKQQDQQYQITPEAVYTRSASSCI